MTHLGSAIWVMDLPPRRRHFLADRPATSIRWALPRDGRCTFPAEPGQVVVEAADPEQLDRATASPKVAGHTKLWRV